MTQLALNLAGYINGVARRHAETTRQMFPGYRVHAITNGVHVGLWTHPAFARLFTANWPRWIHEPEILVRALQLSDNEVWNCHTTAKTELVNEVRQRTGVALDPALATLGFARRMTGYKRPLLLFSDVERLAAIASRHPIQIVLAGKAHPKDQEGKEAIRRLLQLARELRGRITCRVPAELRHDHRRGDGQRRGRLGEHAVAADGSVRNQRHEGGPQWRAES